LRQSGMNQTQAPQLAAPVEWGGLLARGVMMALPAENPEEIDAQVMALAGEIADKRETVERLSKQGKDTSQLRSALTAMSAMFVHCLRYRQRVKAGQPTEGHDELP